MYASPEPRPRGSGVVFENFTVLITLSLVTYHITFSCYGARLHGDERGSVDKDHHLFGGPLVSANPRWVADASARMRRAPYALDAARRKIVLDSIAQTCSCRKWLLIAAHVRTNHVHVILDAEPKPELVMNALKAHASRALSQIDPPEVRRWARHGSTRYLWTPGQIDTTVTYVITGQGEPLEVYQGTI